MVRMETSSLPTARSADGPGSGEPAPPPGLSARRARHRARREAEILKTAAQVVAEHGYHNASVEEVADRLDMAKASIYHYFGSKEELVYACLKTCAAEVTARLTEIANSDGTPSQRLARLIECQISLITAEFPEMARLFLHPLDWPEEISSAVTQWRRQHDAIFREVVMDGVERGEFDAQTAAVGRRLLHSGLNHLPEWALAHEQESSVTVPVIVETAMRMFRSSPTKD
jgi:TetR/AcrR family transcriptional regulator of autoinduction and epiphytic fitness